MEIEHMCVTCGALYPASSEPPDECRICAEPRQYIGLGGQRWTTLEDLRRTHWNTLRREEPGLISIGIEPKFAIGQRALLVRTPEGNVLWDCIPLLDEALAEAIEALGGLRAVAISHPHYYTAMSEWSRRFSCPVLLHAADRQWVTRPFDRIEFWEGSARTLPGGLTLIHCGGHFEGGTVLHWPDGAEGRGVLLTGDILQVVPDRRWVSFMYSYPNYIPLPASTVEAIVATVEPWPFERIYGAFWNMHILTDAHAAVRASADRYRRALRGEL